MRMINYLWDNTRIVEGKKEDIIMGQMDRQWNDLAKDILELGWDEKPNEVRAVYESDKAPAPTKYLLNRQFVFDGTEAPIMHGKKINIIKPLREIEWIMILKSNILTDLHKVGIHFWDNWDMGDRTIGRAYGYQNSLRVYPVPISKVNRTLLDPRKGIMTENGHILMDQIDYLIHNLINNPRSRRHIIMLWNILDIAKMKLPPCVYRSEWFVDGNDMLHVKVGARSSDLPLGNPFNTIQYHALHKMVAQVTGLGLGEMIFDMGNVHIYDRHFEGVQLILDRKREDSTPSQLILPANVRSLYDFNMEDIYLTNYTKDDYSPYVPFEIAE